MFAKLLKYEWKANYKILSLLSVIALALSFVGAGALRLIIFLSKSLPNEDVAPFAAIGIMTLVLFMFFIIFTLAGYSTAAGLIPLYRFYKSKFTDEGYLTFTLPVKARDIFLSSGLNILIWSLISYVVVGAAVFIIVIAGAFEPSWIAPENFESFDYYANLFTSDTDALFILIQNILTFIALPINAMFSIVLSMTSIVLGAIAVKKYKLLASIGFYYGITTVINIVVSVISMIPSVLVIFLASQTASYICQIAIVLLQIAIYAALIIAGYYISVHLMERKLNLP